MKKLQLWKNRDSRTITEASLTDHRPAAMLFGVRRVALLEILLFLAAAAALDIFLLNGNMYWDVAPHPFWVIIILVSVQYGTGEGALAATLASALLLGFYLPEQRLDQDLYEYVFELSHRPLMWFVAAVLVGEMRTRQLQERKRLQQALVEAEDREQLVADAYQRLTRVKDELEARAAGQLRTVLTMYQAAKSIEQLDTGKVLMGVMEMVRAAMNPKKFSVFILSGETLQSALQNGWEAEDGFTRVFNADTELFREVVAQRRLLCAANAADERALEGQGILAGPLVNTATGEVIGMLKVESIGFLELGWTTIKNFEVLCEWVGSVYGNARRYQTAVKNSVVAESGQLFSAGFYSRQIDFLKSLAQRQGFELTLITVALENYEELPKDKRNLAPQALSAAVKSVLRVTDLAFDHRNNGREFAIVLPATPLANARIVEDKLLVRLREELAGELVEARLSIATESLYAPQESSGEAHGPG